MQGLTIHTLANDDFEDASLGQLPPDAWCDTFMPFVLMFFYLVPAYIKYYHTGFLRRPVILAAKQSLTLVVNASWVLAKVYDIIQASQVRCRVFILRRFAVVGPKVRKRTRTSTRSHQQVESISRSRGQRGTRFILTRTQVGRHFNACVRRHTKPGVPRCTVNEILHLQRT